MTNDNRVRKQRNRIVLIHFLSFVLLFIIPVSSSHLMINMFFFKMADKNCRIQSSGHVYLKWMLTEVSGFG